MKHLNDWLVDMRLVISVDVLGCDAMLTCKQIQTFRRNMMSPSSWLKMFLRVITQNIDIFTTTETLNFT
jgi:hypothetical protein